MREHDIVVIGASAGGVEALQSLLSDLPRDPPAALFAVVHTSPDADGLLAGVLSRTSVPKVVMPKDGEPIRKGNVYIAPPDLHMVLRDGHVGLERGPRENRSRPAIDVLFRSAAQTYGARVIGVILTGYLDDGAAGLAEIRRAGGIAIVQDPADAAVPSMPENAVAQDKPQHVVPLDEIPSLLLKLMRQKNRSKKTAKSAPVSEVLVNLTCPDCSGPIYEDSLGKGLQFRCEVGHRYSPESMNAAQESAVENAMWAALRALEERVRLSKRLAAHAKRTGRPQAQQRFHDRATESERCAGVLRQLLTDSRNNKEQGRRQATPDNVREIRRRAS